MTTELRNAALHFKNPNNRNDVLIHNGVMIICNEGLVAFKQFDPFAYKALAGSYLGAGQNILGSKLLRLMDVDVQDIDDSAQYSDQVFVENSPASDKISNSSIEIIEIEECMLSTQADRVDSGCGMSYEEKRPVIYGRPMNARYSSNAQVEFDLFSGAEKSLAQKKRTAFKEQKAGAGSIKKAEEPLSMKTWLISKFKKPVAEDVIVPTVEQTTEFPAEVIKKTVSGLAELFADEYGYVSFDVTESPSFERESADDKRKKFVRSDTLLQQTISCFAGLLLLCCWRTSGAR